MPRFKNTSVTMRNELFLYQSRVAAFTVCGSSRGPEDAVAMMLQELVARAAGLHSARAAVCFDECSGKPPAFYTYGTVLELALELTAFLQKHCDHQGKWGIGLCCYPGINLPSWILG